MSKEIPNSKRERFAELIVIMGLRQNDYLGKLIVPP